MDTLAAAASPEQIAEAAFRLGCRSVAFTYNDPALDRGAPRPGRPRAREIALTNGHRHAYTGNVRDVEGQSTRCHRCGAVLTERDWYELGAWRLDARGRCVACGEPCAGVFEGAPGRWAPAGCRCSCGPAMMPARRPAPLGPGLSVVR